VHGSSPKYVKEKKMKRKESSPKKKPLFEELSVMELEERLEIACRCCCRGCPIAP
jgi:hypothetical protein